MFLLCRRGRWAQVNRETDTFEVVNLADWEQLMVFYGEDSTLNEDHFAHRCAPRLELHTFPMLTVWSAL